METLADRLDRIRIRVQAPGSDMYAELRNRKDVTITFGPSVYEWLTEATMERLVAGMARLMYVEWLRQYRAALPDEFLNAVGAESQNDRDYLAARAELESFGASADGRVALSAVGMLNVAVRIVPGTLRALDEHQFSAGVTEAVHALADDHQAKIRELKQRFFE
jgi:hypothetical protein